MRLDLLAIAAHPDDVELTCGRNAPQGPPNRAIRRASWTSLQGKWARGGTSRTRFEGGRCGRPPPESCA